jgi:hypothetical protein
VSLNDAFAPISSRRPILFATLARLRSAPVSRRHAPVKNILPLDHADASQVFEHVLDRDLSIRGLSCCRPVPAPLLEASVTRDVQILVAREHAPGEQTLVPQARDMRPEMKLLKISEGTRQLRGCGSLC